MLAGRACRFDHGHSCETKGKAANQAEKQVRAQKMKKASHENPLVQLLLSATANGFAALSPA